MQLSQLIKQFINNQIQVHQQIEPWLGNWSPDHETQILVDPTGLVSGYRSIEDLKKPPKFWTDDEGYVYRNIRIPYGAMTTAPAFHDCEQIGPVHRSWQFIGMTGWNWRERKSMWVGYDFDSITNHTEGLTCEHLAEVLSRAKELSYVIARTSKSGKGIHLIVPLNPQPTTRTHTEHSQLAKHVLSRMSKDCGFDFEDAADVGGGNLWHWERGLQYDGIRIIN